jgi:hypothetical protein
VSLSRRRTGIRVLGTSLVLATACSVELAPLSPDEGDAALGGQANGGSGGSGGSVLDASSGGSAGSSACTAFCQKLVATGCPADSLAECMDGCVQELVPFPQCEIRYDAYLACASAGPFSCVSGYAELASDVCPTESGAFSDCTWSFTPDCPSAGMQSGGDCYDSAPCNPLTNAGCIAGAICGFDLQTASIACMPMTPSAFQCQACDASNPNGSCALGTACVGSSFTSCARFCCSDADCGGQTNGCIDVGALSGLKFCGSF